MTRQIDEGDKLHTYRSVFFDINKSATKLADNQEILYHHIVAKVLYLCKHDRPGLQLAVSFLTTLVQAPDVDNYKIIGICLRYLRDSK